MTTRQLACKGPKGCLQAGRTDTQPRSEPFERGETKPLSVSRAAFAGECRDPDGGALTILTRLPPVPEPRYNQLREFPSKTPEICRKMWRCRTAWGNPLLHGRL
eukprot:2039731-Pyramimonas_sp.AAC.3